MPVRIVIADDHRILRAGLKTLLSSDPDIQVVGEATNGEEALKAAKALQAGCSVDGYRYARE